MADSSFAVLNLGSQRVSGAVFSKARNGDLILKSFAFAEMQGDPSQDATRLPQLRIAVLELADRLKLKGKPVWYAIAGHVVFTRFVKLPPFDDDKADQMVEFEARQNVPFPINEVIWDYEFIGDKSGGEREVALVAIKAEALNDINEQVEAGGVKVCGVDLAPLVAYNAFRFSYPDVEESTLLIDLGSKSTNLIFVEGSRVFTRNILVGGSTVTGAIAKELGVSFGEAEHAKRTQGYVAPGGAYEPNPDDNVEAISKIMRNTMTRLHGEVVRTINFYRSQQGGTAPRRIFLCGGGAQTALIAEFFQEKINLPVEVLNPLRGVQMDRRVNQGDASANAPSMTELVGLALRHVGSSPLEVELTPDRVAAARDSAKRAPLLTMAMLCLFAALLVGVFYFRKAEQTVRDNLARDEAKRVELEDFHTQLTGAGKQVDLLISQSAQLEQAVNDRSYWTRFLHALNNAFESEFLWLTSMEITKDGSSMTPALGTGSVAAVQTTATTQKTQTTAPNPAGPVYELNVQGLWRKNELGNEQVVNKYFDDVRKFNDFFAPSENKPEVNLGIEDDRYAYDFKFHLPLVKGMKFDK